MYLQQPSVCWPAGRRAKLTPPSTPPESCSGELQQMIAYIGLGSNVGDRAAHLAAARLALAQLGPLQVSAVYETPPWGPVPQAPFYNQVVQLDTMLTPFQLLDRLLAIEREQGRDRTTEQRWGPRTLDLDLLSHGDFRVQSPRLRLPHSELARRAFVLVPWAEIAPHYPVPGTECTVAELLQRLSAAECAAVRHVA